MKKNEFIVLIISLRNIFIMISFNPLKVTNLINYNVTIKSIWTEKKVEYESSGIDEIYKQC